TERGAGEDQARARGGIPSRARRHSLDYRKRREQIPDEGDPAIQLGLEVPEVILDPPWLRSQVGRAQGAAESKGHGGGNETRQKRQAMGPNQSGMTRLRETPRGSHPKKGVPPNQDPGLR